MWREKIIEFMDKNKKPAWRYAHSYRIYHLAKELDVEQKCDDDILFAVAMLHDIGAYPKYMEEGIGHPITSKKFAGKFLNEIGFPPSKIDVALEAIDKHMFTSEAGESIEAIVIRDSDILDFLGIIGVARSFLKAQDDLHLGYEEFLNLSKTLPNKVVTEKAKAMAEERQKEMEDFIEKLQKETFNGEYI